MVPDFKTRDEGFRDPRTRLSVSKITTYFSQLAAKKKKATAEVADNTRASVDPSGIDITPEIVSVFREFYVL